MDDIVRRIAESSIETSVLDLANPGICDSPARYIESVLDKDWLERQLSDYQAWAEDNSHPFLQTKLLHKALDTNHLVAAIWATRFWEDDPKDWLGVFPTAVLRLARVAVDMAITEIHAPKV